MMVVRRRMMMTVISMLWWHPSHIATIEIIGSMRSLITTTIISMIQMPVIGRVVSTTTMIVTVSTTIVLLISMMIRYGPRTEVDDDPPRGSTAVA